jgi:hypothetical protein
MKDSRIPNAATPVWIAPAAAKGLPMAPFIETAGIWFKSSPKTSRKIDASAASISR